MLVQKNIETASRWDSFDHTLKEVLKIMNPRTILEYGPGTSTKIFMEYSSVELIDSIEHNSAWYGKYKNEMNDKVKVYLQPNMQLYPETTTRLDKYDIVFVDGRERDKCLYVSRIRLNDGGVVMLHDAERMAYKEMIDTFKYKFYTDQGHTVTLTDSLETSLKLKSLEEDRLW